MIAPVLLISTPPEPCNEVRVYRAVGRLAELHDPIVVDGTGKTACCSNQRAAIIDSRSTRVTVDTRKRHRPGSADLDAASPRHVAAVRVRRTRCEIKLDGSVIRNGLRRLPVAVSDQGTTIHHDRQNQISDVQCY